MEAVMETEGKAQGIDGRILINPPGTEAIYKGMQFSQAVRVGEWIWVSGQVGMDVNWQVGEGIEAQTRIAFQNLDRVLSHAGANLADIVELTTFHTAMTDMAAFSKVKSEFFPKDYPAWTAIGVTELVLPALLVEIRATAVVGSRKG
jgi:enamine deaminase RidA (YjgF/YER057c/UK114 family)